MPELPEVETVKNALNAHLKGRFISHVDVLLPRMILSPLDEFKEKLTNVTIKEIKRKGKFLIFFFSNGYSLISHLRMEGKYLYFKESDENTIHTRVIFHLDHDEKVLYDDSRSFGIMELGKSETIYETKCLAKLGPEPMEVDGKYLYSKINKITKEIKSTLLDQEILAGLGNIYVDETLFKSKINPYRQACSLTIQECDEVIKNASSTLLRSIDRGGSTVSSYHPENGVDGKFQNELLVYGRKGLLCACSHHIAKDFLHGRGTSYCPNCQHVCKRVGIYGKIASGKTTIKQYYEKLGYSVFSCDDFVSSLYQDNEEFKKKVVELFSSKVYKDGHISKGYIKEVITSDSTYKKKLENIIFPLVKDAIDKFSLARKEEEIVFLEIPLLFESHSDLYCDYIIGVDVSLNSQIAHLKARGSLTPELDLSLNASSKFDKYVSKCNYVIHNDGSLEDLYHQLDESIKAIKAY